MYCRGGETKNQSISLIAYNYVNDETDEKVT